MIHRRSLGAWFSLIGFALCAVGLTAGRTWTYAAHTESGPADAAVVLGAAVWGDQPSPVFRERINHAVSLYRSGRVSWIVFTGGLGNPGEPAEAQMGRQYAIARGVPLEHILVETTSSTTRENLLNARQLGVERGISRWLLVSDPIHMRRAVQISRDLGMDAYPSPTPTTMYRSLPVRLRLLVRETRLHLLYALRRPLLVRWHL